MKTEKLVFNDTEFIVKIIIVKSNQCGARIKGNVITIKIPLSLNREQQFKEVLDAKAWARKKIEKSPERFKQKVLKQYKNGEVFKIGQEEYRLIISFKEKASSSARIEGNTFSFVISSNLAEQQQQEHISTLLSRIMGRKRLPVLQEKIHQINNQHFQQPINKIFFKNLTSKWGSCSSNGNINISTRLLFAPDDVLEYVLVHELSHKVEFNHSDRFWSLVEKAMPNYKEKEQWLKEKGGECMF